MSLPAAVFPYRVILARGSVIAGRKHRPVSDWGRVSGRQRNAGRERVGSSAIFETTVIKQRRVSCE